MSIVAVHGPNTFGSRAITETEELLATVNPANGLMWDFNLDGPTTRSNQDFSWAFPPDGTPTPQLLANPTVVTYAAVGSTFGDPTRPTQPTKTATLTVTNTARATINNKALTANVATVAFSAPHGFIPGQRVTITGTIGAPFLGTFTLLTASGSTMTFACVNADVTSAATTGTATSASDQYPTAGAHTLVVPVASGAAPALLMAPGGGGEDTSGDEYPELPDEAFDPGEYTVAEVQDYVNENPDQIQEVYDAEVAGKNRITLVTWLEEYEA